MGFNIPSVNRALKEAGIHGELVRGKGYFYFVGDSFYWSAGTSVWVFRVTDLSIDQWIEEALSMIPSSEVDYAEV